MQTPHGLTSATARGLLAVLLLGGCTAAEASDVPVPPAVDDLSAPSLTTHPHLSSYHSARVHIETPLPVRLRIPDIDVDTSLERLGIEDDVIEDPSDRDAAGWWEGGPRPGQVGPAVILGHVDSRYGAAVFYELKSLDPGDEILVDREDGSTARFVVTRKESFNKKAYPSDLMHYPTFEPELRLVTCGGKFDRITRHYSENFIVFATQAS